MRMLAVVGRGRAVLAVVTFGLGLAVSVPTPSSATSAHTPGTAAYWLVAADGRIFAYGGVRDAGPGSGMALRAPIVGIAATPDGRGYWEVASDGGIFALGGAGFFGSMGGKHLNQPIVGIAATPDGMGYWEVASDGGIFAFNAPYVGSMGGKHLNQPIVGIAATPDGKGYWEVASDGGIFAFGGAGFFGSTGSIHLNQPIAGMTPSPSGAGYWFVASDGGIFAYGDAHFRGSAGSTVLSQPIVGMAQGLSVDPYSAGSTGYDISWPQCGSPYPSQPYSVAIVGVNDGKAFIPNPCLALEANWGRAGVFSNYMNINAPPTHDPNGLHGPAGACATTDPFCYSYNYGFNAALDAYTYAVSLGASAGIWWLDVETANTWDINPAYNARTIQGALDALVVSGVQAGIYSTSYQFGLIAGSYSPGVPIWIPTGADYATAVDYCTNPSKLFGGGKVFLTQYGDGTGFDRDYACP